MKTQILTNPTDEELEKGDLTTIFKYPALTVSNNLGKMNVPFPSSAPSLGPTLECIFGIIFAIIGGVVGFIGSKLLKISGAKSNFKKVSSQRNNSSNGRLSSEIKQKNNATHKKKTKSRRKNRRYTQVGA